MKTIILPVYNITLNLRNTKDGTSGSISCASLRTEEPNDKGNFAVDIIESMVLAHACAGINIEAPAYLEGLETAIDNIFAKCN